MNTPRVMLGAALGCAVILAACGDDPMGETPPARLARVRGNGQTGAPSQTLPVSYAVRVMDSTGAPAAGATVQWIARRGAVSQTTSMTGPDGVATTTATLADTAGVDTVLAVGSDPLDSIAFVSVVVTGPAIVHQEPIQPNYGLHDTFVRSGLAFASAWNTGVIVFDVGDGRLGGGPAAPVPIRTIQTGDNGVAGGRQSHNSWWFHNPVTSERRYLFVGQEGPGFIGSQSSGDIYAVDVSDLSAPTQVASFRLPGAGTHNFWMDEPAQVLYAAYYNGGVVAIDVSGTLAGDLASRRIDSIAPGGAGNTSTWSVQLANGFVYAVDMLSGVWQLQLSGGSFSAIAGGSNVPERFSSDFWVYGNHIYSGTWGSRGGRVGNAVKIWRLDAGGAPALIDSIIVTGIATVSDVQVSDDGRLLVFSAEGGPSHGLHVYGLTDPENPTHLWTSPPLSLHTATIADINGRRYVFAARNPGQTVAPAMVVFDVTDLAP
jgi:hypothetical protein